MAALQFNSSQALLSPLTTSAGNSESCVELIQGALAKAPAVVVRIAPEYIKPTALGQAMDGKRIRLLRKNAALDSPHLKAVR